MARTLLWLAVLGLAQTAGAAEPAAPGAPARDPAVVASEFIFETAPFRSCHASTLAETKNGLAAAWFGGTGEGKPDVGIWLSRHSDKGWSAPVEVANGIQPDGARHPCWNPVLFQAPNGPLLLFYKVGPTTTAWWGMRMTSDDGGATWSKPEKLPDDILGPVKNKPVLLADGTLLCGSSKEAPPVNRISAWHVYMELTKDLGKTWQSVGPLNDSARVRAIQPTLLVWPVAGKPDGRIQAICRSAKSLYLQEITSEDGGKTWTPMKSTTLPNVNSGIDGLVLKDGRALLVYDGGPAAKRLRTPLCVAVSADGAVWKAAVELENEPGEYSYPAAIQTADGLVHVTYTWKRSHIKHVVLDPAKFTLRDMVKGEWPK